MQHGLGLGGRAITGAQQTQESAQLDHSQAVGAVPRGQHALLIDHNQQRRLATKRRSANAWSANAAGAQQASPGQNRPVKAPADVTRYAKRSVGTLSLSPGRLRAAPMNRRATAAVVSPRTFGGRYCPDRCFLDCADACKAEHALKASRGQSCLCCSKTGAQLTEEQQRNNTLS